MRFGLRTRLIGILVLATIVTAAVGAVAANVTIGGDLRTRGAQQVETGITGFGGFWDARRDAVRVAVAQVALDANVRTALTGRGRGIADRLGRTERDGGLQFLTVVDAHGRVVARAEGAAGGHLSSLYLARALQGETIATAAVLSPAELDAEGLRSYVDAELAGGAPGARLSRGLALITVAPISDANERVVGAVYGGVLLNHADDLVERATGALGGRVAVLLDGAVIASTIPRADKTRLIDAASGVQARLDANGAYLGPDVEGGTPYLARVQAVRDEGGNPIAALWYGVPTATFDAVRDHATLMILAWGVAGILIGVLLALPVVESLARGLIRRAKQVRASSKELAVVIVGSEVSGDHVRQTRENVERAGELLMSLATAAPAGEDGPVATRAGVSTTVLRLSELNAELLGDVTVIETLNDEMAARTAQAVERVRELDEVAGGLEEVVTGARS